MPKQEAGRLAIWFRELSKALDRSGRFVGTGDVIAGLSAPLRTKLSQARLNLFGVNYQIIWPNLSLRYLRRSTDVV